MMNLYNLEKREQKETKKFIAEQKKPYRISNLKLYRTPVAMALSTISSGGIAYFVSSNPVTSMPSFSVVAAPVFIATTAVLTAATIVSAFSVKKEIKDNNREIKRLERLKIELLKINEPKEEHRNIKISRR